MGTYLNPQNMEKEEWLGYFGTPMAVPPVRFDERLPTQYAVCLVQNPAFSAAAVAFDQRELDDFADPSDHRPKRWYWVSVNDLRQAGTLI